VSTDFIEEVVSFFELIKAQYKFISQKNSDIPFSCIELKDIAVSIYLIDKMSVLNKKNFNYQQFSLSAASNQKSIIYLWFDVWENKKNIVQSRIKGLLKLNKTIFARQTLVQRINKKEAEAFLNNHHLMGYAKAAYHYGLKYTNNLIAVASFSRGRKMIRLTSTERSFELIRFASMVDMNIVGGLSKLINYFEKNHHPGDIMTYTDLDWGMASSFEKLGFRKEGFTSPHLYVLDLNAHIRHYYKAFPSDDLKNNSSRFITISNAGSIKYIRQKK
jgi:hypothetical protein